MHQLVYKGDSFPKQRRAEVRRKLGEKCSINLSQSFFPLWHWQSLQLVAKPLISSRAGSFSSHQGETKRLFFVPCPVPACFISEMFLFQEWLRERKKIVPKISEAETRTKFLNHFWVDQANYCSFKQIYIINLKILNVIFKGLRLNLGRIRHLNMRQIRSYTAHIYSMYKLLYMMIVQRHFNWYFIRKNPLSALGLIAWALLIASILGD